MPTTWQVIRNRIERTANRNNTKITRQPNKLQLTKQNQTIHIWIEGTTLRHRTSTNIGKLTNTTTTDLNNPNQLTQTLWTIRQQINQLTK